MRHILFSVLYLYSGLVCCIWPSVHAEIEHVEVLNGQTYQLPIVTGETTNFYLDLSKHASIPSHAVFQVHSQWHQVKVSFDDSGNCSNSALGRYSVGTNVGLMSLSADGDPFSWCLSPFTEHSVTFKVLVIALVYKSSDPVPGGCNLELPLKNDPNLYLKTSSSQTNVQFAYGDLNVAGVPEPCGSLRQRSVPVYDVYQMYLAERSLDEDTFFAAIGQMLTAEDVTAAARLITRKTHDDTTSVEFVAYYGQGVVYAVVMRLSNGTSTLPRGTAAGVAAYVPAVTYSCNFIDDQCAKDDSLATKVTVGVLGCVGILLCFFGHRLFPLELYVCGYLSTQLTMYILTVRWSMWTEFVCFYVSLIAGLLGGLLWLLVWAIFSSPPLSMVLVALCLGYIVSCVVFLATPLTVNDMFLEEYFYQVMFFVVVCLIAVVLLAATVHKLSLLSCAVIGSYLFVLAIDWFFIGSGVQQMVLNSIRKSAIPGFSSVYVTVPYQIADIRLYTLWSVLSIVGFLVQLYMERNRPQFPLRSRPHRRRTEPRTDEVSTQRGRADDEQSERQPLLFGVVARHGSVGLTTPSSEAWQSTDATAAAFPPPPSYS